MCDLKFVYLRENKNLIFMRIKISICLLFSLFGLLNTFAQEKQISGVVKNPQGLPQANVLVQLKGKATGSI